MAIQLPGYPFRFLHCVLYGQSSQFRSSKTEMIRIILFTIMSVTTFAQTKIDFKPERIQRSSTFHVEAPVERSFPLFGPLLEMEWAAGWEPRIIYLQQKYVEEHMIFTTKS